MEVRATAQLAKSTTSLERFGRGGFDRDMAVAGREALKRYRALVGRMSFLVRLRIAECDAIASLPVPTPATVL